MAKKTKAMIAIEERLTSLAPGSLRFQLLTSVLDFKHAWVELGRLLTQVRDGSVYKDWGFDDFERYCERELHIKKQTAHKLTATYGFMERREPTILAEAHDRPESRSQLPDYDVIRVLTEAEDRGQIGDDEYQSMRGEIFDGAPPTAARVQKLLKTRWPTPPPPEQPVKVRLTRLARAIQKIADAADSLPTVPPELKARSQALADDFAALAVERAA